MIKLPHGVGTTTCFITLGDQNCVYVGNDPNNYLTMFYSIGAPACLYSGIGYPLVVWNIFIFIIFIYYIQNYKIFLKYYIIYNFQILFYIFILIIIKLIIIKFHNKNLLYIKIKK